MTTIVFEKITWRDATTSESDCERVTLAFHMSDGARIELSLHRENAEQLAKRIGELLDDAPDQPT
jgi:hypothetical protein